MGDTMNTKFTPGPWAVDPDGDCGSIVLATDGIMVADCNIFGFPINARPPEINAANASLVAAAPDLYEACKIAATAEIFGVDGIIDLDVLDIVIAAAMAAIGKAEVGQ